ncbi:reverse transcriptase domain-containing protein [Tanacetum coccineum]
MQIKVRNHVYKPVVAQSGVEHLHPREFLPDVDELKDMSEALLLDKEIIISRSYPVKAVEEVVLLFFGDDHSYHLSSNTVNLFPNPPVQQGLIDRPQVVISCPYQAPPIKLQLPQNQGVLSKEDFQAYVKANDAVMRNMQTQGQNIQNQLTNITDMLSKFVTSNTASTSGTLPSNTVINPKEDLKGITTQSGVAYKGPTIPITSSHKVVEREPEVTKDTMLPTNNGSTKDVQPPIVHVVHHESISEPVNAPVSASRPNQKSSIPFPARRNDERRREKANDQIEKFYEIFRDLSFKISFTDALMLMPKFAATLKTLIGNKEKLSEMAKTPLNENCSAVILNKLPKKLGDPGRFLIPCEFSGINTCNALADLGASINLMPYSVWKNLSLPELTPTCMTLELADRSISEPIGIAEDVYVTAPPPVVEPFNLEEPFENPPPPPPPMDDQRTMAQLLEAPTAGYEDAIVVPEITADNFELKHGLLNLVQNKQFFGHDKEDPHAHIRYFNKIPILFFSYDESSPNVPSTSVKLMLFPFSLEGEARIWLEKEPPRSIQTWDDLVSKFINKFFPPSKTTNLRNEITRFQQRFDETFYEAWDRFNDLLRACPHHGFSELHQLDTFYNALNSNDQDSLNSAAGGNFLDKMPRDCLRIIESKSKVRNSRNKPVVAKVSASTSTPRISSEVAELKEMVKALLLDKKNQSPAPNPVKAVEESCVTCSGAHSYQTCPATSGNVYRDNIQEYVSQAAAANYNQGNSGYQAPISN